MQKQHLDGLNVEFGILGPLSGSGSQLDPEFSAALSAATNDWQIKEWLEPEPRLRSGMIVPAEHSEEAVAEIERLAGHPGFVQVLLVARSSAPLGDRRYWKMYEAAARHDLPIGIHYGGGVRGVPISKCGLAVVLPGGSRGDVRRVPGACGKPDLQRDLRPAAEPADRVDRGRVRLAAVAGRRMDTHWSASAPRFRRYGGGRRSTCATTSG